jgi:hypothetical protein
VAPRNRSSSSRRAFLAAGLLLAATAGCSFEPNLLGGREKCWPEDPPRAASLWRGILRVDVAGGRLETPEGEVIPLAAGTLAPRVTAAGAGELVRGSDVVAKNGDDITIFGGAGADGFLVACDIEEVHARS